VIPIEESLLYVRPLYLRASGGRIPELKRVIVAHQNLIVMEETLEAGLDRLFGAPGGAAPRAAPAPRTGAEPAPAAPPLLGTLAARAREAYERALKAQREGDWARYGEEIRKLGALLEEMAAAKAAPPPSR